MAECQGKGGDQGGKGGLRRCTQSKCTHLHKEVSQRNSVFWLIKSTENNEELDVDGACATPALEKLKRRIGLSLRST